MKTLIKTSFVLALLAGFISLGMSNAYAKKGKTGNNVVNITQTQFKGVPFKYNIAKTTDLIAVNAINRCRKTVVIVKKNPDGSTTKKYKHVEYPGPC